MRPTNKESEVSVTPERLSLIEELYHSAREREPGERSPFLAEACQGDEEFRREVESLLATEQSSGTLLEAGMREAAEILGSQPSGSQHQLPAGLELGPYVIEARLGAGGMGEVYRARDKRLGRMVALKVLPTQLALAGCSRGGRNYRIHRSSHWSQREIRPCEDCTARL